MLWVDFPLIVRAGYDRKTLTSQKFINWNNPYLSFALLIMFAFVVYNSVSPLYSEFRLHIDWYTKLSNNHKNSVDNPIPLLLNSVFHLTIT